MHVSEAQAESVPEPLLDGRGLHLEEAAAGFETLGTQHIRTALDSREARAIHGSVPYQQYGGHPRVKALGCLVHDLGHQRMVAQRT